MIAECSGKELEGRSIVVLSPNSLEGTDKNHEKTSLRITSVLTPPEHKPVQYITCFA
jgi:hypothetical protein